MRLIFAGSPAAALPSLEALAHDHDVVSVLTRQDAPRGRKRVLTPSVVASRAEELSLNVVRANRITPDVVDTLATVDAELGVIVAYGALLREPLLSVPRLGWINLHFSLLPRWRGAAPVQHALIAGDDITGVSVFQLVPELDAGPLWAQRQHRIAAHATAGQLLATLAEEGADVLARVVGELAIAGDSAVVAPITPTPQEGDPTFAPKLTLEDGRLRFATTAEDVYNQFRGVTPEPGAFAVLAGERVKLQEIEPARDSASLTPGAVRHGPEGVLVGTGSVPMRLRTVQPAGKRAMSAAEWWRGLRETEGLSFDD